MKGVPFHQDNAPAHTSAGETMLKNKPQLVKCDHCIIVSMNFSAHPRTVQKSLHPVGRGSTKGTPLPGRKKIQLSNVKRGQPTAFMIHTEKNTNLHVIENKTLSFKYPQMVTCTSYMYLFYVFLSSKNICLPTKRKACLT